MPLPHCLLLTLLAGQVPDDGRSLRLLADAPYLQPLRDSIEGHANLSRSAGLASLGATARVDVSWLALGQRWFHGRFLVALPAAEAAGAAWPVLGSDFWYAFNERTGAPIACDLPEIASAPALAPPRLSKEDIPAVLPDGQGAALPADRTLEVLDLCVHPQLGLVYPVILAATWSGWSRDSISMEDLAAHPNELGWIDASSGQVLRREPIPHRTLSGVLRGPATPLTGNAARRAVSTENPPTLEPAPGRPLELHDAGDDTSVTVTDELGAFAFDLTSDGLWGLRTLPISADFCWQEIPAAELAQASASGTDSEAFVEMQLEAWSPQPFGLAGQISMWSIAVACRAWSLGVRQRIGLPTETLERHDGSLQGRPGVFKLQLWRFHSSPGRQPVIGAYSDTPWPPRMGTSLGNDLVNDGSIATWHEYGHYEMLSLTGTRHLGGWPLSHHPASAEAWADAFMDYALARADPHGDDRGWIGWGRDVGHEEDAFHRDIARGLAMGPRGVEGHVEIQSGHDQWPNDQAEIHAAGMPVSGSFWLLRRLLMERFGARSGLERAETILFSWVGGHCGGAVPNFTPLSVERLLLADDAEGAGGDDFPRNGSPHSREIKLAFAAHNLHFFDFVRGDANSDGHLDLADAVFTLNYLFLGGRQPDCLDAADANDSGSLELGDAVITLGALFLASGALPPPSTCGIDPTPRDRLPCQRQPLACGDIR